MVLALLAFALTVWSFGVVAGQENPDVMAAEVLVRQHYFEGIPYEAARELTPEAVVRLAEMLESPEDAPYRANIVMALGMSGQPGAYEALAAYADQSPEGLIEGTESRARLVIPLAMGHLAQRDQRALGFLVRAAQPDARAPRWRHRRLKSARLGGLLRRGAITGLAIAGRPEAGAALRVLSRQTTAPRTRLQGAVPPFAANSRAKLRRHLDEALELHSRVSREGAARVFGRKARR
jgi:hypothetical protein